MNSGGGQVQDYRSAANRRLMWPPTGWSIISLLLGCLSLLLIHTDWLWRWDQLLYDSQLRFWSRPAAEEIVIVAIDASSLAQLGRWPWNREQHARLVRHLTEAGAKAVALDILFAESEKSAPDADQNLIEAVNENGRVVLPILFELSGQDGLVETLPMPKLARAAASLGHVHIDLDPDGIARRIHLLEGLGSPRWPSLALALLRMLEPEGWKQLPGARNPASSSDAEEKIVRDYQILLPFAGPPGHFRRISYVDVVNGNAEDELFRDKIVLVGATATGLGDSLPTPVSGWNQPMPGVEINANLIDALRRGIAIQTIEPLWRILLTLSLLLAPFVLYPRLKPRFVLLTTAALLLAATALSATLLHAFQIWFPPVPVFVGLLLGYPLWSLLRLEHTVRYFEQELRRLHTEPRAVAFYDDSLETTRGLEFLRQIVPFEGWTLRNAAGRVIKTGPPQDAADERPDETTFEAASEHRLLRLPVPGVDGMLEIRLPHNGTQQPSAEAINLLHEFLAQIGTPNRPEPKNTVELIEKQIQQVQQAVADMRSMRALISDTLRQMLDAVLVVNSGGQVVLANSQAANLLEFPTGQSVAGTDFLKVTNRLKIEGSSWYQAAHSVLVEKQTLALEGRTPVGRELLIQMSALSLSKGNLHGMILILSDITQLKQSERKRVQAINFLSHDLRSPITSLLSLLQLNANQESTTDQTEMARRVEHYARKALSLADSFLQLARAENADNTSFHETDFVTIAHNAVDEVYAEARSKEISLTRDIEIDEAWLLGDAGLLERALINLLENAIRYSPAGTCVQLSLRLTGDKIECCVKDQGEGIPSDDQRRIFYPFQRGERSNNHRPGKGTGLGLSLVKVVAEKHHGSVTIDSKPGAGSRFCLHIPMDGENH